ncbi:MAG TPA: helix-turn-helix transcriptional regulator [Sphingomicrobium sp.]|nr:helix-turn-helix transcriptional regulator [Sphingomicrobium sp.]
MESASSVIRFSLEQVPERERSSILREEFGRGVINTDFVPLTDAPWMELEIRPLPGVMITFGAHSPYCADTGHDASRGADDFNLVWATRPAKLLLAQRGRELRGDDGTAAFFSGADRLSGTARTDFHFVNIRLQRSLLGSLLPRTDDLLMRPIPPHTEALKLLNTYVGFLRKDGEPGCTELAHAVSLHIADLVALAVGTTRDASERAAGRGLRAARAASVKAWMLERISDPGLSISAVAATHRISPRYVQMLFEDEGTSFSCWLRAGRLTLARRRLADPAHAHRSIASIAYDCGFSDLSWFNHAFRQAFGETPSDVRQGTPFQTRH